MFRSLRTPSGSRAFILVISLLALAAITCSVGGSTTGDDSLQATNDALVAQITAQAGGEPLLPASTQEPGATPGNTGASGSSFSDNFSKDQGFWSVFDGVAISGNQLLVGPFKDCADIDVTIAPMCFSVCTHCGILTDYDFTVDGQWTKGPTDRYMAVILRFDDKNDNNIPDRGQDYFLAFVWTAAPVDGSNFQVWEYIPISKTAPWLFSFSDSGPFFGGDTVNTMRFVSSQDGHRIDIYGDAGIRAATLTLDKPIIDERLLASRQFSLTRDLTPVTSGKIGLGVIRRGVQAAFSNFSITIP
ncbi:MAG TPA: hypothetical protein VJJ70_12410 [Anaerolineales bacterium]|nr:hypothetical protein [Anaerolineales bacterium]